MQYPDARIALGEAVEYRGRAVLRPVIGKNDLGRLRQPVERVGERPMQFGERVDLVVHRNDDRNIHTAPPSRRRYRGSTEHKVMRKSLGNPARSGETGYQRRGLRGRGAGGERYCWTRVARRPGTPWL